MIDRNRLLWIVTACLILSLGIESAQAYIPGRFSSLMDVVLNTFGAGLGGALCSIGFYYRQQGNWHKTRSR